MFLFCGAVNTIGSVFIYCFMKETKGLTHSEIQKLYLTYNQVEAKNNPNIEINKLNRNKQ